MGRPIQKLVRQKIGNFEMKNHNLKILIWGHVGSGKSTFASLISEALTKADIPNEVRDANDLNKPLTKKAIEKSLRSLSQDFKYSDTKVIIETKMAKRTEKIV
jgi:adenylate kinase family enzyme